MRIKELQKAVNIAWSPQEQCPILLAAGSAAQQLDTSFTSASPTLELYSLNLTDPGYDLDLVGVQQSAHKFHNLVWSPFDHAGQYPNGVIIGGCESGFLKIYSVAKMLAGEEALVAQSDKHNGPVRTVDYNPFKSNLIASAASDSEIFIWDVNNTTVPMTPGTKTQPSEDVCGVAWNRQVQHILASSFATRCVIWDLRKNEPIIKLSDTQSRVRWRAVQWHPDVATQLWLASEDDQAPVIQLWDLRYATAPSKTLQIHTRGVLGMARCPTDPELMISCAKDNKILCWNSNSEDPNGEVLSEIASTNQWYTDVTWCPRNPAIIAASSFDGSVSVYSLFGGTQQQVQTTSKIADSFPGMETHQEPHPQQPSAQTAVFHDMTKPPKWLKRPSGISFGFGGKLVSFNANSKTIEVKQLVTDENLVTRSSQLETVLTQGNYGEYCREKADASKDQHNRYVWHFLKAYFNENPTSEFLNLLGYQIDDVASKFSKLMSQKDSDGLTDLNRSDSSDDPSSSDDSDLSNQDGFELNGTVDAGPTIPYKLSTDGSEGLICEAMLTGNIPAAVELCMNAGRSTDAIILASLGGSELLASTQYRYLKNNDSFISNLISAMVMADWSGVISQCTIDSWKEALVAALTHSSEQSPLLCERLGERLQIESGGDQAIIKNSILCYICAGNIERIVDAWSTVNGSDSIENSEKLQEIVEIVVLLNKALEKNGKQVAVYGKYAELLSKYASLLAAQGSLNMALTYIGTSQDDANIVELRERLYYASGHKQQQQQVHPKAGLNHFQPRMSHPRTISASSTGIPPSTFQPAFNNSFNTGLPNAGSMGHNNHFDPNPSPWAAPAPQLAAVPTLVPRPPTMMNPADNLPQPPRPSSVSSVGSASQPAPVPQASRRRILDPSVTSGPTYGQMPAPTPMFGGGAPVPAFNTNPVAPAPTTYNPAAFNSQPVAPLNPLMNQQQPNIGWDQQSYGGGYQQNNNMNGAPPPPMNVLKNPTPPPGWNDPPEFKPKAASKKPIVDAAASAPITHPLFGVAEPQSMPGQNQYGANDQMYQPQQQQFGGQQFAPPTANVPAQGGFYQPQQQQQLQTTQPTVNYQNFQTFPVQQQQQPQQTLSPPPPHVQEPPKQKPPLPEEFIYMQTVLDELKSQCTNAATNPQTKRKLDDVAKRLEILYDLLREQRLSQSTLESLNQLVQLIQIGDYGNGLALHTQMVSGPDFSKIASFMPGIKILLQLAMQLQVYLR